LRGTFARRYLTPRYRQGAHGAVAEYDAELAESVVAKMLSFCGGAIYQGYANSTGDQMR